LGTNKIEKRRIHVHAVHSKKRTVITKARNEHPGLLSISTGHTMSILPVRNSYQLSIE